MFGRAKAMTKAISPRYEAVKRQGVRRDHMLTTDTEGGICWINKSRTGERGAGRSGCDESGKLLYFPTPIWRRSRNNDVPCLQSEHQRFSAGPQTSPVYFCREEADKILMVAFLRAGFFREIRDYRLLELVLPSLRGVFDDAVGRWQTSKIRTLLQDRGHESDPLLIDVAAVERAELLGVGNACRYLKGFAVDLEIKGILLPERTTSGGYLSGFLGAPVQIVSSITRGVLFPHARELRLLYRIGIKHLRRDAEVCKAVRAFLHGQALATH